MQQESKEQKNKEGQKKDQYYSSFAHNSIEQDSKYERTMSTYCGEESFSLGKQLQSLTKQLKERNRGMLRVLQQIPNKQNNNTNQQKEAINVSKIMYTIALEGIENRQYCRQKQMDFNKSVWYKLKQQQKLLRTLGFK